MKKEVLTTYSSDCGQCIVQVLEDPRMLWFRVRYKDQIDAERMTQSDVEALIIMLENVLKAMQV